MGKRLALVVGVSEYGEGFDPLPGSLLDLQKMEAALQDPECGAFEVKPLSNCDRATLETEIEQFFRSKDPADLLLFYFSGHGDLGSGGMLHQQLHLCTHNTRKEQGRVVESSALSASFLKRQMDLSKAQQIVVILDCCYSGAIADLLKKGEGEIDFGELKAKGRVILASSSAAKVSLQAVDGLSLYTRYLTEGMTTGAAYVGPGAWIAAKDLHTYAERRFEIENKGYSPKIIAEETSFNLPIVRVPKPDPRLDYRQAVDRMFQELDQEMNLDFNGVIEDELDRGSLETRRQRLGLAAEEAAAIEKEVQQPYLIRATQRQEYAKYFCNACKDGLPSERARRRLAEIRQNLSLGEADAERLEQRAMQQLNLTFIPVPKRARYDWIPTDKGFRAESVPHSTENRHNPVIPVPAVPVETPQEPQTLPALHAKYQHLEELLSTQQWREADQETYRLMITAVGKKEGNWFTRKELLNFPCEDLKAIDGLWGKYSQGRFGFSVQKRIYVECGAKLDGNYPGDEIWERFGDRVGWRKDNDWLSYSDLNPSLSSPQGILPRGWVGWSGRRGRRALAFSSLAQRLVNCNISQF